ncbi:MAG TPA: LysR family transcriptional regulator [Methanobacteriaceae archaeon]|nr:LysR family transcriptional regulator [Methanobacteriaceae archaeon]HNS25637.1 LysR family transcriptional regulator [Methanobacteriaceae archaeon]
MDIQPKLNLVINGHNFSYKLFETLHCISKTFSQRKAAKRLGISHAVLNRRIKDAEAKLGFLLVESSGSGSVLTSHGLEVIAQYQQLMKRLSEHKQPVICGGHISTGLMDSLCHNYGLDSVIYSTDDLSALKLAEMGLVDILTLDDPVHVFMRDLDFTPLAYDYLVLVSPPGTEVNSLKDLEGQNFVEVPHSAQRLAWNTLDHLKIDYNITEIYNSPYTAFKKVQDSQDLYSFLNRSLTTGWEMFADDTRHLLTSVLCSTQSRLESFIDYVSGRGQRVVEDRGFERI